MVAEDTMQLNLKRPGPNQRPQRHRVTAKNGGSVSNAERPEYLFSPGPGYGVDEVGGARRCDGLCAEVGIGGHLVQPCKAIRRLIQTV
jgi:hypothetical protein